MVSILSEEARAGLKSLNANFRKGLPNSTSRQGEMARILVEVFNAVLSTAVTAESQPKQEIFRVIFRRIRAKGRSYSDWRKRRS
jgi:hypothetical protein